MSTATRLTRAIIGMTIGLAIAGCATPQQDAGDTDAFLRNAFDAYGVIDVIPAPTVRREQMGEPLDATGLEARTPARRMTLREACVGLSGVQTGLRNQATGEPIDCGNGAPTS